jgi:hypothetical protein
MSQVDKQRVIAEWLARRKDEDLKGADKVASGPPEARPLGAIPFCAAHRWVTEPDGALLACLDCGLVVTRPLAS